MDLKLVATEYPVLRAAGRQLSRFLVERLQRNDFALAADDLGIRRGKFIDLETHDEIVVVADHAVHEIRHQGLNVIDRVLRDEPPAESSIEMRLLRSLQKARFTIFSVVSMERGIGVYGIEGSNTTPSFIADIGFSKTALPGATLATRLFSPADGWSMTTGAALPVKAEALKLIDEDFRDYVAHHGREPQGSHLASLVLRNCIAAGASHSIAYQSAAANRRASIPSPISEPVRVGRNEPCPCGSGIKHKKCCGR